MELGEDLVPLDVETVHLLDVGLLDFLELGLVTLSDLVCLPLFGQLFQGLDLALAALSLDVSAGVLILFLFHYQLITYH